MEELHKHLRRWRLERLRALGVEGAFRFGAALSACLLAALLLDRFLTLNQSVRWGLFCAGAAAFAGGLYLWFLRPLRLLEAPEIFAVAARAHPSLRLYLRSAWELARGKASPHTSEELARAHLLRAERLLRGLPGGAIFPSRPSRPALKRASFAAAAWGLAMPWLYNGQSGFQRVLAPWRDQSLDALVEVSPGDRRAVWAERVEIRARWRAAAADRAPALWLRQKGGGWRESPWDRSDAAESSYRVERLTETIEYRLGYKDLRTRVYRLEPIPYPHMRDIVARVHLPGGGPAERPLDRDGGGELASLRRSWVTVRGRPDRPLASARLQVSFLRGPVDMKPLASGEWEGGFPLNENGTLTLDLLSEDGARDPEPVAYALRALDDHPPAVELLSPAFELEISPRERLTVTYEARDDYGLLALAFLFRVTGAAEKVVPLAAFKKAPDQHIGDYSWDLSGLPAGARVEFRVRATDNSSPHAQTAVSHTGVLRLVDFESAHEAVGRKWTGAEEAVRALAEREEALRAALERELARGEKPPPEALARLAGEDKRTAEEWDKALGELEQLARAMKEDPLANPGMTETAELLHESLRELQKGELPQARRAQAEGKLDEARRRHGELARRVEKAAELLQAGREVQAMQDFWGEAHRMDQAGGELQSELQKLAKGGKAPTPEQQKQLQEALAKIQEQMDALAKAIDSLPKAEPGSEAEAARKVYHVPLKAAQQTASALQQALARGDFAKAAELAQKLARELSQVRQAIAQAAHGFSEETEDAAARKLEEAQRLWQDVVEQQSRSLQMTERLEEEKLRRRRDRQEELLRELAREQKAVVADSERLGPPMPADALRAMGLVVSEFERARVETAPELLKQIVSRLSGRSLGYPAIGGRPAPEGAALLGLAERERKVLDALTGGAGEPPLTEAQLSEMMAASAVQRQTRQKTEELSRRVDELSSELGVVPPELGATLGEARGEQERAEGALGRRQSGEARGHQQKALELLQQGQQSCEQAAKRQQSIAAGATRPFGQPRGIARPAGSSGRGGRTGVDRGFVPLPKAEDYQPPREIRKEVEKSLRERRPKSLDETIDEYLKRMSQ